VSLRIFNGCGLVAVRVLFIRPWQEHDL